MEIFKEYLFPILIVLLTALFGSIIPRKLKERECFIEAATEFRRVFNQALVDTQSGRFSFGLSVDVDMIKTQEIAYRNFRHHLCGICRNQYDGAWEKYHHDFENMGHLQLFTRISRVDLEKDIEHLLEFAEHRFSKTIVLFLYEDWFRFRLKYFGPDKETKETKELIDKLSHIHKDDNSSLL